MKIALISLNQEWKKKSINFKKCLSIINSLKNEKIDCIIFPELTLTGFCFEDSNLFENIKKSKTLNDFEKLSSKKNINIIFGSLISIDQKTYNTFCLSQPNKKTAIIYKKINTFIPSKENLFISNGKDVDFFTLNKTNFLPSICFDLRFPLHYLSLSKFCQASICIANWPKSRISHWHTLLKARAIENQMYLIGVNRIGVDGNGLNYSESSEIYDPFGEKVKPNFIDDNVKIYDINFDNVKEARESFRSLLISRNNTYLKKSSLF